MSQLRDIKLVAKNVGICAVFDMTHLQNFLKCIDFTKVSSKQLNSKKGIQMQINIDNQILIQLQPNLDDSPNQWNYLNMLISIDKMIQNNLATCTNKDYKQGTFYQLGFLTDMRYSLSNAIEREQKSIASIQKEQDIRQRNKKLGYQKQSSISLLKAGKFNGLFFSSNDQEYNKLINAFFNNVSIIIQNAVNPYLQQTNQKLIQHHETCIKEIQLKNQDQQTTLYQHHLKLQKIANYQNKQPQLFIQQQQQIHQQVYGPGVYCIDMPFTNDGTINNENLAAMMNDMQTLYEFSIDYRYFNYQSKQQMPALKASLQAIIHLFKDLYNSHQYTMITTPKIVIGYREVKIINQDGKKEILKTFNIDYQENIVAIIRITQGKQQLQQLLAQQQNNFMSAFQDDPELQFNEQDVIQQMEEQDKEVQQPTQQQQVIQQPVQQPIMQQIPQQQVVQQQTIQQPIQQQQTQQQMFQQMLTPQQQQYMMYMQQQQQQQQQKAQNPLDQFNQFDNMINE